MHTTHYSNRLIKQAGFRPTAGALGALCEENFGLLARLMPTLSTLHGRFCMQPGNHPPLAVEVSRDGPYTQQLFMTHLFPGQVDSAPVTLPDATLHIYHDAGLVEVQHFGKQMILPVDGLYGDPGLYQKWRANLFLGRWLRYCLSNAYMLTDLNQSR